MNDPWKYLAFPVAAIAGYLLSQTAISVAVGDAAGLDENLAEVLVVGLTGLAAGFLVDDMIPAYIEHVRGGSSGDIGGDMDMGGGGDDFDFD